MAQNVEFVLDGKEAGAVRAWLAVQRAQESVAASLDKVGSAQEKVNRIDQAYAKVKGEALRVLESLRTAEERRTKNIQSLANAQKLGVITADEYRVGMERLHQQMNAGDASFAATESRLGLVAKGFAAAAAAAAAGGTAAAKCATMDQGEAA